jgi:hypothetical protein
MDTLPERRHFQRTPLDFEIKVVSQGREGILCEERTRLEDISGEGVRFLTQKADSYYLAQLLDVIIFFPGTNEVKASMKGKAKVVWIGPCSNPASNGEIQPVCVAVKLDAPLYFERYVAL